MTRFALMTAAGAAYGGGIGFALTALGSMLIAGPVAPVAQLSILTFTTLPGAAFGALAAFERT